jgi:hypothetical protein
VKIRERDKEAVGKWRMMSGMVGLTENRLKRDVPDSLVITTDLGAVGFCYNPETHEEKHPKDTFVIRLTSGQMKEIGEKALKAD